MVARRIERIERGRTDHDDVAVRPLVAGERQKLYWNVVTMRSTYGMGAVAVWVGSSWK
jgi:3-hydroxy-3-methylglutaryl CoA synthase